jgi:hypothetical protein
VTAELDEEEVWIRSEQRVSGRACPRAAGVLEPGSPRGRCSQSLREKPFSPRLTPSRAAP